MGRRCLNEKLTSDEWCEILFWMILGLNSFCALASALFLGWGRSFCGGGLGAEISGILVNPMGKPLYLISFSIFLLLSWIGIQYSFRLVFQFGNTPQTESSQRPPEFEPKPAPQAVSISPWHALKLSTGASRSRIQGAYRHMIQKYHPDKVAEMGTEIRQLAERKAKEINQAYEELQKERSRRNGKK